MGRNTSPRRILAEGAAVSAAAFAFLLALAPTSPFTHELGVCESGAVRDVLAGNIILPHFVPGPMVHVPPLYWWTAALGVRAFGWTEIALRMPSMIAAALTCAIVFAWAAIALNRRTAFWAAASLILCHFFLDAARQPRMDSMLALFVTAAAIAFERALRPPSIRADTVSAPIDFPSRRMGLTLAALAMGPGILTKGILGVLLPGLVAGLYLVVRRRWREIFRADLIVTFVVAVSIGLSWYFAAYEVGGQKFLQWQLAMNLWSRFIPADVGGAGYCAHPFWYFTPHTITGFIPWSVYLPALVLYVWPRRGRDLPEAAVFTRCWFAAIFGFFSASQGKCLVYILPAFPPLAVLTGIAIDAAASALSESRNGAQSPPDSRDRAFTVAFAIATAAVAAAAIAIALAAVAALIFGMPPALTMRLHPTDRRFLEIFTALATRGAPALIALIGWIFASIAGGIVALVGLRRRDAQIEAAGVFVIAAAGSFFWFAVMNPAMAERETLRDFARDVAYSVPAGSGVAHLGLSDCDLNFYSPQPLTPIYRLTCDANAPRFIVARKLDFAATPAANRSCFKTILESPPVDSNGPRVLLQRIP
jgi:4-amino-4-deoxy-L-arabinose transferase-like glycosyltransferase